MKTNTFTQKYDYSKMQRKLNRNRPAYVEQFKQPRIRGRKDAPLTLPLILKFDEDDCTYIATINSLIKNENSYQYYGEVEKFVQSKPVKSDIINITFPKVPGGQNIQYSSMWTMTLSRTYPDVVERLLSKGNVPHSMLRNWSDSAISETDYIKIVLSMDKEQINYDRY